MVAKHLQDKKKAELDRQKELAELFAVAIKQPKVPVGMCCLSCYRLSSLFPNRLLDGIHVLTGC